MSSNRPRVSVGMPVYNGENYIREALDSILAQTFQNFELVISDNASTDATDEICKEYLAKDERIRYYRTPRNMGATWNQNQVFKLSQGEYFKLAAHDDICAPEFLEKCVEALDQDSSVVLAYPWTKNIDQNGEVTGEYDLDGKLKLGSSRPPVRFRSMHRAFMCYPIFGVIRSAALKQTPLLGSFGHADGALLSRLTLMGRFHEVPQHLFLNRRHPEQSTSVCSKDGNCDFYAFLVWWDPDNAGRIVFPTWRLFGEYCKAIAETPITLYDQARCYLTMASWLRTRWVIMLQEVVVATNQWLHANTKAAPKSQKASQGAE
ncbi:glycosyltransferase family 2 protein [Phormidesmis priestleyi]|nr:glycosyltransferase family 2 protein [Phormidesmis priestleyi]